MMGIILIILSDLVIAGHQKYNKWYPGIGIGFVERIGNVVAVNGYSEDGIKPIIIQPGERYDVEMNIPGEMKDQFIVEMVDSLTEPILKYYIPYEIPLIAEGPVQTGRQSLYTPKEKSDVSQWLTKAPDHILDLSSTINFMDRYTKEIFPHQTHEIREEFEGYHDITVEFPYIHA